MLDDRKAAILRAVVEEYIATAQPVGSAHVVRSSEVRASTATVRNEMAVLERDGFLVQPHTSAGRIPTDKGYRFFVDQLTEPGLLHPGQRQQVREFFNHAHGELEQMLHDTGRLLSDLTHYAAVVVAPAHEAAIIRSTQLVGLGPRLALLVVVLSNGVIEKRTLELAEDTSDDVLHDVTAVLNRQLSGRGLADLGAARSHGNRAVDAIVEDALRALGGPPHDDLDQVIVRGASRMASAFDAVETVRQVLATLEEQYLVVSLLRDLLDRGLTVSIGAEHGLQSLAECSIVLAPYAVEGERTGSIAVLGPTRMDYPQTLAAVAIVSERLGRRLTEG
jgi:heat-inducible transcriptional repressor